MNSRQKISWFGRGYRQTKRDERVAGRVGSFGHMNPTHIHNWTRNIGVGDLSFLAEWRFHWRPVLHLLTRPVCLSLEHITHGGRHPWETGWRDGPFLAQLRQELR